VAAPVREAEVLEAKEIPSGQKAKPVQLKRVMVKIKRGTVIGSWQEGLICLLGGEIKWKGGQFFFDIAELDSVFRDEFESANYTVVGEPDALFDDPSAWKAEYLIGAIVTDIDVSICGSIAGVKGQIYLEVNWQVYSRLDRKVVFKTTTEGSYEIAEFSDETYDDLVLNGFGTAIQNLLADEKFYALVAGETQIAAPSPESFNKLVLAKSTKYKSSIEHTINDVRMGVVTVFAGGGHGSGFFVDSEGHLLTSAHVVSGAKFVKIKLVTGREILGEVLRKNPRMDIALIKAGEGNMASLPINERELNIGAPVCAISSPLDQSLSSTVTRGILSAYRTVEGNTFIQSDVNVLPGSSGCPLVDHHGNAVGISVAGVFLGGAPAGLNFFVPVNQALNALNVEMVPPAELESKRLLAAKEAERKPAKPQKATSGQTQGSQVASTSPAPDSIPKPDPRLKLAILPYYMKSSLIGDGANVSPTNFKNTSINSLNKVLRKQREIVATYSYYELAKEFKAKKITGMIINDKDVNKLWVKKSGSTNLRKPNINLACKIGNKLTVDTVLLSSFTQKSGEPNWTMAIYFIDIETKKTFSQTTSINFRTYQNEVNNFTEQSFISYSMKKFKSQSDSASGFQVAAIPTVNKKEPWTGIWKVEGSHQEAKGVWGLKQRGKSVRSTKDSYFEVKGKVNGTQLEGRYTDDYNLSHQFVIKISSDGQSFEGKIFRANQTILVKGRRKQ